MTKCVWGQSVDVDVYMYVLSHSSLPPFLLSFQSNAEAGLGAAGGGAGGAGAHHRVLPEGAGGDGCVIST